MINICFLFFSKSCYKCALNKTSAPKCFLYFIQNFNCNLTQKQPDPLSWKRQSNSLETLKTLLWIIRNWAKVVKTCENQNIHADDIRGNFEMTTKGKFNSVFQNWSPITKVKKNVSSKIPWERKCTGNNWKTAPFAKVLTGQGFCKYLNLLFFLKLGIKNMSCIISSSLQERRQ